MKSLCQTCYNYAGCPWHESFTPRKDWVANASNICNNITSYEVVMCPAYISRSGKKRYQTTLKAICALLGINGTSVVIRRERRGTINDIAHKRGFHITSRKYAYNKYRTYYIEVYDENNK